MSKRALKLLAILLVLLVITLGYILLRPHPKTPLIAPPPIAPAAVTITHAGFSPSTVSVKRGQAVIWTNTDVAPHGIISSAQGSDDFKTVQNLSQNDSYTYVFDKAGNYTYHDSLNPTTLSGTVVVK